MKLDIRELLNCDYMVQLVDWKWSAGAKLEQQVAKACRIPHCTIPEFMNKIEEAA